MIPSDPFGGRSSALRGPNAVSGIDIGELAGPVGLRDSLFLTSTCHLACIVARSIMLMYFSLIYIAIFPRSFAFLILGTWFEGSIRLSILSLKLANSPAVAPLSPLDSRLSPGVRIVLQMS